MNHIEDDEQAALFEWAEWNVSRYPVLAFLHHIPNGGKRDKREAARLKRQGVKSGVPDVFLPYPNSEYAGLYIEMKTETGRPTENQKKWNEFLNSAGYKAVICRSFEQARETIVEYLEGGEEHESTNTASDKDKAGG